MNDKIRLRLANTLAHITLIVGAPIWIIISLINNKRWNKGICHKCESAGYEFISSEKYYEKYKCTKCHTIFKSIGKRKTLTLNEVKSITREKKLNKLI